MVAEKLGQPFMPWQALVADVGGEIDPISGLPAYREIRVTVPRQSGKTTLFLAWQINRCVSRRWRHPQRSVFTAQTGKDARDKWIDELFPLIRNSRLKELVAVKGSRAEINEGMGNESIRFRTGSRIRLLSTATTSGHSKTLHQAVMDEVWHDTDDRREQGLRPAMITVPDAQLLVCSTAGTETSVVLNRKVETGRVAAEADTGGGVAYFEWSAPEGWNADDVGSYYSFMPALCPDPPCRCARDGTWHHTITSLDAILAERAAMESLEFRRAYGNVATGADDLRWQVIPEADWFGPAFDPDSAAQDPVAFAVTVSTNRQWATICAAGQREDGLYHVTIVDRREGTGWVIPRLTELWEKWSPCAVVINKAVSSPAASLAVEIEEASIDLLPIQPRDEAAAAGAFFDGVAGRPAVDPETGELGRDPRVIRHRGQDEQDAQGRPLPWASALTDAVAGAMKRPTSTVWDQVAASADISPLIGVSNALWGFRASYRSFNAGMFSP